jgi:hypothetical protein
MDVRRAKLRSLIAQWGGPSPLAKKLKLSGPSYLSQLLSGHRPITEKTARQFENELGLPPGWMDDERHTNGKPATVDDDLVTRVVLLVGAALEEAKLTVKPAKFADLVAMAYDEAIRTGELSEMFVKRLINLTR